MVVVMVWLVVVRRRRCRWVHLSRPWSDVGSVVRVLFALVVGRDNVDFFGVASRGGWVVHVRTVVWRGVWMVPPSSLVFEGSGRSVGRHRVRRPRGTVIVPMVMGRRWRAMGWRRVVRVTVPPRTRPMRVRVRRRRGTDRMRMSSEHILVGRRAALGRRFHHHGLAAIPKHYFHPLFVFGWVGVSRGSAAFRLVRGSFFLARAGRGASCSCSYYCCYWSSRSSHRRRLGSGTLEGRRTPWGQDHHPVFGYTGWHIS